MHDDRTSLTLLERVRNQDQEAWQRLLYLYGPLVQYWCGKWGLQSADADDLQQDVFATIAHRLDSFRRDRPGDTFRGWLRVIAHRKFLDFCRKRKRLPATHLEGDLRSEAAATPDAEAMEDPPEEVHRLHCRALELLRSQFEERTWQAFWQCAVDGRAPADVAADMNMTSVGVRKAKSRVLHRLREELGEVLN